MASAVLADGSFAETEMLSTYDIVYLDFKDRSAVQVGASYVVFRPQQKVYHPRSGKFLGYLMQIVGTVKVNGTREPKVRAVVDKAFDDLRRGDRIGPARERLVDTVHAVPNAVALQNLIVIGDAFVGGLVVVDTRADHRRRQPLAPPWRPVAAVGAPDGPGFQRRTDDAARDGARPDRIDGE